MTELPTGWALARIDDLVSADGLFCDGDWVESKDQSPRGEVRLTQLADVGEGKWRDRSDRHLTRDAAERLRCTFLEAGDVLVARMPDPLGRACLFPGDPKPSVTVVDVAVIRPGPAGIRSDWLMWAINAPGTREQIEAAQSGTTRKRISRRHLGSVKLGVPPLPEQVRIVASIEEAFSLLDAGEAGLHATRTRLKRMRDSVFAAAVTGQLVPQNPTDTPAAQELAAAGVEPIVVPDATVLPSTWAWATLGDMSAIGGGIQKQPKRRPASNPVPFLRVANVGRRSLDLDDVHQIEVFPGELERYGLESGDLLVVEGNGSPDQIGRAAVWQAAIQPCVHQNHLIRVRPLHTLSPSYLGLFWNSPEASARVQAVSSSTSGLHTLSTGKLRRLPVAVPPVEEQSRIVAEAERQFSFIEAAERAVEAALLRSAGLRRSVLKAAFQGQLVPQDPADEPASVLVERIAAERATAPKRASRRGRAKVVEAS